MWDNWELDQVQKKEGPMRRISTIGVVLVFLITLSAAPGFAQEGQPWHGQTVDVLAYGQGWCFFPLVDKDGNKTPLCQEFETETGITINFEFYNEDVVRKKAMLELASGGTHYDVIASEVWGLAQIAQGKYFEPLEPYIRDHPNSKYFALDDFAKSSLKACSYDGVLYSLPIYEFTSAIAYRADLLAKDGLPVPRNTEELTAVAKACTKDLDGDGKIDLYGMTGRGRAGEEPTITATGFAWAYGGTWFEDNANTVGQIKEKKAKPTVNTPEFVAGFGKYCELLREFGDPAQSNWSYVEANQAFVSGRAAMYVDATTLFFILRNQARDAGVFDPRGIEIAPPPVGPAGKPVQCYWSFLFGINAAIPEETKLAAWQVLQLFSSAQFQMEGAKGGSIASPRLSVLDSDVLREKYTPQQLATLTYTKSNLTDSAYMPMVPEYAELCDILGTAASAVIAGQKTAQVALDEANEAMYQVMKAAGYYD
jgi:ABC-type glycerol-3-phosphate transport system substrate-binding protein